MKKYIVAIDWSASYKTGFDYVDTEAKNMTEAKERAWHVAANRAHNGHESVGATMDKIYCIRLITQTARQATRYEATDTGLISYNGGFLWKDIPADVWNGVEA